MAVFCWENIIFYYKWVLPDELKKVFLVVSSSLEVALFQADKVFEFKFALFLDLSINHG